MFGYTQLTVGVVAGTAKTVFSFDAAVVSGILLNAPHSGYASVTVAGLDFGQTDHTATGAIVTAACGSSSWSSATSVTCLSGPAQLDALRYAQMSVGGVAGTGRTGFSFDAAVGSAATLNSPHSGYASVTVSGLGFGAGEQTATAALERGGGGSEIGRAHV